MDEPSNYPLAWPADIPRTKFRQTAAFSTKVHERRTDGSVMSYGRPISVAAAMDRLTDELRRLGVDRFVVSTNVPVRRDGLPYSNSAEPADPGVAVFFTLKKRPYCLPCDRWTRVADNLAAIAAHVSALRGIERWGVGTIEQAFTGYLRLPDPNYVDWRAEFPRAARRADVLDMYRERAQALHPDVGGDHDSMVRLNRARDAALAELPA